MTNTKRHRVTKDNTGEPVCSCGWDPALTSAATRVEALLAIADHQDAEYSRHQVHNHGPSEGRGLDCPEQRGVDGLLRGACVAPRERWRYEGRVEWHQGWHYDLWQLVANPGPGRNIGAMHAIVVPA